jgi:hypothetical protein
MLFLQCGETTQPRPKVNTAAFRVDVSRGKPGIAPGLYRRHNRELGITIHVPSVLLIKKDFRLKTLNLAGDANFKG